MPLCRLIPILVIGFLMTACDKPPRDAIADDCAVLRERGIIDLPAEEACKTSRDGYLSAATAAANAYAPDLQAEYNRVRLELEALFGGINAALYPAISDASAIPDLLLDKDAAGRDLRGRITMPFSISLPDENQPAWFVTDAMLITSNVPQRLIDALDWPCMMVFDTAYECRGEFFVDKMQDSYGVYEMGIVALRLAPMSIDDFRDAWIERAARLYDQAQTRKNP